MLRTGLYVHYKGDMYEALYLATLSEYRSEDVVVYRSQKTGEVWARPHWRPLLEGDDCWRDLVVWPDGVTRPRFVHVDDMENK